MSWNYGISRKTLVVESGSRFDYFCNNPEFYGCNYQTVLNYAEMAAPYYITSFPDPPHYIGSPAEEQLIRAVIKTRPKNNIIFS